ncbi:MAG: hypothetical protein EBZ50_11325, partial [Alphaproteobacteria bacterium]|nr:hypothetical protein [Alphaproteobacteria bacterium]
GVKLRRVSDREPPSPAIAPPMDAGDPANFLAVERRARAVGARGQIHRFLRRQRANAAERHRRAQRIIGAEIAETR